MLSRLAHPYHRGGSSDFVQAMVLDDDLVSPDSVSLLDDSAKKSKGKDAKKVCSFAFLLSRAFPLIVLPYFPDRFLKSARR